MRNALKVWPSILIGAFLVAWLCTRTVSVSFLVVFLSAFLGLAIAFHGFVWVLLRLQERDPVASEIRSGLREIEQLPIETVKNRVEHILQNTEIFRCVTASRPPPEEIRSLGTYVSEVLLAYEKIETVQPEAWLGWYEIGRSNLNPEFTRIGYCVDGTEIVVKAGGNTIYVIDGSEQNNEDLVEDSYPSIYHWILATYTTVYKVGGQD